MHALMIRLGLVLLALAAPAFADAPVVLDGTDLAAPLTIDDSLLHALPRQTLEASEHGRTGRFEGVWLRDLLARAGAPLGEHLRGPLLRDVLEVRARDGYRVVFSLAELDAGFRTRPVLLADRRDGKPLSAEEGPLRLVVADEQRPARWIRQISGMRLLRLGDP